MLIKKKLFIKTSGRTQFQLFVLGTLAGFYRLALALGLVRKCVRVSLAPRTAQFSFTA